jgi:hypothetical protein
MNPNKNMHRAPMNKQALIARLTKFSLSKVEKTESGHVLLKNQDIQA